MRTLLLSACLFASSAAAEVPRVVADIAPVHGLVSKVMEGLGTPDLILPPGVSPHHHAMRPSEARALSQADLVIWVGHGLTPWLEKPLENLSGNATHISLAELAGVTALPIREAGLLGGHDHGRDKGHDDDHGHEDSHGHKDSHGHEESHGHDEEKEAALDPHLWLDPGNASIWLDRIAEALAEKDPENASLYRANAAAGRAEISEAEGAVAAQLAGLKGVPFILLHDAFQYFEAHFGLEALAAVKSFEADAPGPARLSELRGALKESGARCALSEPQIFPMDQAITPPC